MLPTRPEIKFARLIAKRHDLEPGFSIKDLLGNYADIVLDDIPDGIDGISLNIKDSTKRPKVIISTQYPAVRRRFTMAHELGHIVIPWHVGVMISHTDENHAGADFFYDECEAEANRFAAELLMPAEWLEKLVSENSPLEAFHEVTSKAKVSAIAAFISLGKHLPTDYIGVITDSAGSVKYTTLNGSRVMRPPIGKPLESHLSLKTADEIEKDDLQNGQIIYFLRHKFKVAPEFSSSYTWREVLYEILDDEGMDRKVVGQICGCLSFISNKAKTRDQFYSQGKQRILTDVRFAPIFEHPRFEEFLVKRIDEFIANWN